MPRRVLLAWSGGKDSTLALAALRAAPDVEVAGLVTAVTAGHDRISIHGVRRAILHAQGLALGLPVFEATLQPQSSNADYETAWAAAVARADDALGPTDAIAFGDLFLEDVRAYREALGARAGFRCEFPLWGRPTAALAAEFVAAGYEAYLTCVDTTQCPAEFAGRRFDDALLRELPASVDPCGEHGEFHTCVVDGPVFAERISVARGAVVRRDDRFEYCDLVPSCPECGARYESEADSCAARFDRLLALDHSQQEPWGSRHGIAFAVFALQHPRKYPGGSPTRSFELLDRVFARGEPLDRVVIELRGRGKGERAGAFVPPPATTPFPVTIADLGDFTAATYAAELERWCRATLDHLRQRL